MGKLKIYYNKNRWAKIERNRIKRKDKVHNPLAYFLSKKDNIKNKTLQILSKNNFFTKMNKEQNKVKIKFPKAFCFIKNPDITLNILKQINTAIFDNNVTKIYLDYSNCEIFGLDASLITDVIILEGIEIKRKMGYKVDLVGNIPKTPMAREIFLNSGLIKHLGISKIESPNVQRLDPFIYDKNTNLMTNKVIEYYNNCLRTSGYTLNEKGINHFNKLIGEIIGNADEHSGKNGIWFVSGHFSKSLNETDISKGRLTFISFGNTIYESLKKSTNEIIKNKLENQTKLHKNFFGLGWNEESSWTVFALQWMISSKKTEENDRGTGTIKFIESFTELGKTINNEIPKMIILSGHTYILFDGTYTLKDSKKNNKITKAIAFNKNNDLNKKADGKYVKLLNNRFPGTIISCEFYVDKEYLKKIKEK